MSLSQRGALADVKRIALGIEATSVRGTPGSFITPSAVSNIQGECNQADLPDGRQLGSRKSAHESHLGVKDAKLSYSAKLTENSVTHLGPIIKAALGKQWSQTALVLGVGSDEQRTVISAGVPDHITRVGYDTGRPDYLPTKTYNGTEVNHAILSRIAARTVTSIKNAKETTTPTGACYSQDPTADFVSLYAELDQGSEPNDLSWQMQGLVPSKLQLAFAQQDRVGFDVELTGVDWSGPAATSANIIEQAEFDKEWLGYVWDVNIQDLATPVAAAQIPLVAIEGLDLAPTWIRNDYCQGRADGATLPGSNGNGWKQGKHFSKPLEITVDVQNTAWNTAREAGTKYQIFLTGYAGQPGAVDSYVICIWFPECILDSKPESVEVNGIMGHKLKFLVRESLDITVPTHCAVAIFNT